MTDEEFVRAHWERVLVCDGSYRGYPRGTILFNWANHRFYDFASWSAAAEFTRNRLEEIRQLRQDIAWCAAFGPEFTREELDRLADDCDPEDGGPSYFCVHHLPEAVRDWCARNRILARLESALAELTRGMKGDA